MTSLVLRALLAGVFFGIWPLLMNRSGLPGNFGSLLFILVTLAFILPFGIFSNMMTGEAHWQMIVGAGFASAVGLLFFNSMLAVAKPSEVGTLFVVMVLAQIAVPAVYQTFLNGGLSMQRGLGFLFAGIAGTLLVRS